MPKKKWSEMTPTQQTLVLVGASIEVALTATALIDLARRPAQQVRGPKGLWALGIFVQPVGPVSYLVFGIRRGGTVPALNTTSPHTQN